MNVDNLKTFGERLEFLLDLKDIKKGEFADKLNIAPNTLSNYIKGNRCPSMDMIIKIADTLNVSTDFLLMRSNNYNTYVKGDYDGNSIEIQFKDGTEYFNKEEIQDIFKKLESAGFLFKNN